jgi:soluble lytic murein transglycosylase-like protein
MLRLMLGSLAGAVVLGGIATHTQQIAAISFAVMSTFSEQPSPAKHIAKSVPSSVATQTASTVPATPNAPPDVMLQRYAPLVALSPNLAITPQIVTPDAKAASDPTIPPSTTSPALVKPPVNSKTFEQMLQAAAERYDLDIHLLHAIAETESRFNPHAVSPAGAIGVMQLMPTSGGLDAMRSLGLPRLPTRNELYNPKINIELGARYVALLDQHYFAEVLNPKTRELLVIAAYNGGMNNALKVFAADKDRAIRTINALAPQMVYDALKNRHTSAETRGYVQKVTLAKQRYKSRV